MPSTNSIFFPLKACKSDPAIPANVRPISHVHFLLESHGLIKLELFFSSYAPEEFKHSSWGYTETNESLRDELTAIELFTFMKEHFPKKDRM